MTSEDFSAWLSAMSLLSEGQRAEAMAALEKAGVTAGRSGGLCEEGWQA